MTGQERIRERVAKLEDTHVDQSDEEPLAVILIGDADDIKMADDVDDWVSYPAQVAMERAKPHPPGVRPTVLLDPDIERAAVRQLKVAQNGTDKKN